MIPISIQHSDMREYRALLIGIAASLAIHAMVLCLAPGFRPQKYVPELPTLTAVLRDVPQPETLTQPARGQPQPETEPPRPAAEPRPKPEAVKPRVQAPLPLTAPSLQPAPTPAADAAAPDSKPAPAASAAPASAVPAPPAVVATTAPSVAATHTETVDPDALRDYQVHLGGNAAKYMRYPRTAVENNWEGIAEVKLTIGENGRIRALEIATSSGHDILDQQAIEMVRKAAPLTEIPGALRNKEFNTRSIFIRFNIERKGG